MPVVNLRQLRRAIFKRFLYMVEYFLEAKYLIVSFKLILDKAKKGKAVANGDGDKSSTRAGFYFGGWSRSVGRQIGKKVHPSFHPFLLHYHELSHLRSI